MTKKRVMALVNLPGILLLCGIALISAVAGFDRLENWCLRKLQCSPETK